MRLGANNDETKKGISKLQSSISSKALLVVKMMSSRTMQHRDRDDQDDEDAVWKRKIIMGERCRPLEFSGSVLYDSNGNPLHDSLVHPPHGKK